ncbi:MAG: riboflavin kinase, partial [bacterium]|nr:riboflavin kinase [bacterium]
IVSVNETYPAAIHIGPNPTFGEDAVKVEVHLIGYEGNLYNSWLQVEFLQRLRGIEKFDSVDQLTDQLASDVELTQQIANAND